MGSRIQTHPDYSEGFWEAQEGIPLQDHVSDEYRAGWEAFQRCKQILTDNGFTEQADGSFGKTTAIYGVSEDDPSVGLRVEQSASSPLDHKLSTGEE